MRTRILLPLLMFASSVHAAPTILECTVTGSHTDPNTKRAVSETLEVRVDEIYPDRAITVMGKEVTFVAYGAHMTGAPPFKIDPEDRSTKDVWDMSSKQTMKDATQKSAIHINRRTGAISATNHNQFATGFWTKFAAKGTCVAQSAARKF